MSVWTDILDQAIPAASEDGPFLEPAAFLALCETKDRPLEALVHDDLRQEMFDVLSIDLQFDWATRASQAAFVGPRMERLIAALRWLRRALGEWQPANDPKWVQLTAILALGARLDENGALWSRLPGWASSNEKLGEHLAQMLGQMKFQMRVGGYTRTPINDQEDLNRFLKAETDRDWSALRFYAEHINFHFESSAVLDQSTRILNRFFPDDLARAARSVNQLALAMQIVTALSAGEGFALGASSQNPLVQFAAICRLFVIFDRVRSLEPADEDKLIALLIQIASDLTLWASWMKTFVSHPHQTHEIQAAVGAALATLEDDALIAYANAIFLDPSFVGRESIANCLEAFASRVPVERRQRAWRAFFRRWDEWNFGAADDHHVITEISLSNIDFAIVGYAMECLSADEREAQLNACMNLVGKTEDVWHSSQRDMMNYVHRALARLQPFAHARLCSEDRSGWLWNKDRGYFAEQLNDPFWISRFALFKMAEKDQQINPPTRLP
jgi:hypothetical protein